MTPQQQRAWHALGLGPRWVAQGPVAPRSIDRAIAAPERVLAPPAPVSSSAPDDPDKAWQRINFEVHACQACGLASTRQKVVVGQGSTHARCLLIGEAPGAEEDRQGQPFVGRAGALLDQMLSAAGIDRERDVYVTNTLKCRPPGNRNPQPDELAQCSPFLARQIALLEPRVIVLLGRFAAQAVLSTDASIASLRGRIHRLPQATTATSCIVTYHPAYLLRNPADKALAWRDWVSVRRALGESAA
jgi:DNA polymerase